MKYYVLDDFRNKCGSSVDDEGVSRVVSSDCRVEDGRRLWSEAKRARGHLRSQTTGQAHTSETQQQQLLGQPEVVCNTLNV